MSEGLIYLLAHTKFLLTQLIFMLSAQSKSLENHLIFKAFPVGVTGFEPATTRPPDAYSNRAELHPALVLLCKGRTIFSNHNGFLKKFLKITDYLFYHAIVAQKTSEINLTLRLSAQSPSHATNYRPISSLSTPRCTLCGLAHG